MDKVFWEQPVQDTKRNLLLQGESRMAGRTDGFITVYFRGNLVIRLTALTDDPNPTAIALLKHIEPHEAAADVLAIPRGCRSIGAFGDGR
jgi:hypothetical protein